MNSPDYCPISGDKGIVRRVRRGREIAKSYQLYLGQSVPDMLVEKYFAQTVQEYQCDQSGLRWYTPAYMGESDFYEWLADAFPWYYSSVPTWDKLAVLDLLAQAGARGFVEIGSGGGVFLELARERGIAGIGTEINEQSIRSSRAKGLDVYHADDSPALSFDIDTLVSIQSLEHVTDPLPYLRSLLEKFAVQRAIIAVPCFETLLGHTLDPLAWPPHHFTSWSQRAFETLGSRLGYELEKVCYEPMRVTDYRAVTATERSFPNSKLWRLPRLGPLNNLAFAVLQKLGPSWLSYRHTIIAVLRRRPI